MKKSKLLLMKTNFWLLLTAGMATVVFNSYGQEGKNANNSATTDAGVVINGVKWATRNVDAPGTFAAAPEDFGMFYQWGHNIAWSATDPMINSNGGSVWDKNGGSISGVSISSSLAYLRETTWKKENDPSPVGWRVPTIKEMKALCDKKKVAHEWITQNGVAGVKLTDIATGNTLFLPAAGGRYYRDGSLYGTVGLSGYYWVSSPYRMSDNKDRPTFGFYVTFWKKRANWNGEGYRDGNSVRCVAE